MNVKTAHGTVHTMTAGRTFRLYGRTIANREGSAIGKADCGALTSGAAKLTSEPATCRGCAK